MTTETTSARDARNAVFQDRADGLFLDRESALWRLTDGEPAYATCSGWESSSLEEAQSVGPMRLLGHVLTLDTVASMLAVKSSNEDKAKALRDRMLSPYSGDLGMETQPRPFPGISRSVDDPTAVYDSRGTTIFRYTEDSLEEIPHKHDAPRGEFVRYGLVLPLEPILSILDVKQSEADHADDLYTLSVIGAE